MTEREIRVEQRYLIEVEVRRVEPDGWCRVAIIGADTRYGTSTVHAGQLRAGKLIEKPLAAGDSVKMRNGGTEGEIRAIEGEVARVKWPDHYVTEALSDLERAP